MFYILLQISITSLLQNYLLTLILNSFHLKMCFTWTENLCLIWCSFLSPASLPFTKDRFKKYLKDEWQFVGKKKWVMIFVEFLNVWGTSELLRGRKKLGLMIAEAMDSILLEKNCLYVWNPENMWIKIWWASFPVLTDASHEKSYWYWNLFFLLCIFIQFRY